MTDTQQRHLASQFAKRWKGKGYEKGESQIFWISLLRDVLGEEHPEDLIEFESQVHLSNTAFIDGYIERTHVLIEQKGLGKDLRAAAKQSDGAMLTPFEQAKRYSIELPYSKRPRWLVTCNFESFLIYDMEKPQGEPQEIKLAELEREIHRLRFLVDDGRIDIRKEMEVSIAAGAMVGRMYDALLEQYKGTATAQDLHSLNVLCVRLVFCLYAEDAGIFPIRDQFYNYLNSFNPENMRVALKELFQILDTPIADRSRFLEPQLAEFPYVAGSIFKQQPGEDIPPITHELARLLLDKASRGFDWSEMSPTIFGAVFESTLNPETRRSGGMHYTSIENIHRVIDPLFLDELKEELASIKEMSKGKDKNHRLEQLHQHIADLDFLDPACGSGNFLTETYISLRRLENEIIFEELGGQAVMGIFEDPIRVKIDHFHGIEINDFAISVAMTALWIAESQMMKETEKIVLQDFDFLPLTSYTNLVEANALHIDWETLCPSEKLDYIIGNPPFVGARLMSNEQKTDMLELFGKKWKNIGNMDYVTAWYYKSTLLMAAAFEKKHTIRTALVSTNSITQGEQVSALWSPLMKQHNVHIDFAWRTFRWDSESMDMAHVHCVIVGFSVMESNKGKLLFEEVREKDFVGNTRRRIIKTIAENINGYLMDAPSVVIDSRSHPLCNVPEMVFGSMPNDGGFLSNYSKEDRTRIITAYPETVTLFRKLLGSTEFINSKERWCLWLKGISPNIIRKYPPILDAVIKVQEMRKSSNRESTRRLAEVPYLFGEIRQPDNGSYLLIPRVSSENRSYVPMGFCSYLEIASDAVQMVPCANITHFGIMCSSTHMAWMRAVCGRLESRYRYSAKIVYNNFPWPETTPEQEEKISATAQGILDARALYPDSSLADLYDDVTMPIELRKAHQANDKAVLQAYGFSTKDITESQIVAELFRLYASMTNN